jgi:hypothetical protein
MVRTLSYAIFISLLALSLSLSLTGCPSPLAEDTSDDIACDDVSGDMASFAYPDTGAATMALTGRWAVMKVITATITIAGSSASENKITTLAVVDMVADGDALAVEEETCSIDSDNIVGVCGEGSLVTTILPQAYIDSMGTIIRSGTVTEADGKVVFHLPMYTSVRGAILDDPINDALPTDPNDPAYFDQDNDGKPGMTLRFTQPGILVGELYVGQKDWTELHGTVVAGGRIEGHITWDSEQVILGSNPESISASSPKSAPSSDPDKSFFVLVRIDEGDTCQTVMAQQNTLFAPN